MQRARRGGLHRIEQQLKMGEPASAADACAEVALSVEQVAPMQGFKSFDGVDPKSTRFAVFPGNGEEPKASVASRASVSRASTRASKRHLGAALLGALHHGAGPSQNGFGNHLASASSSWLSSTQARALSSIMR